MSFTGFRATKGGSNQTLTNNTTVQMTFGTVVYDVGSHFGSNVWTPPAGKISLLASARITAATLNVAGGSALAFTKNGGTTLVHAVVGSISGDASQVTFCMAWDDVANGTDAYGVGINGSASSGTPVADGSTTFSSFSGYVLPANDCFAATNGTTAQGSLTSGSPVTVTYGTEVYDVGSLFATNAWVPPAGVVWLKASVYATGTTNDNGPFTIAITKNGTAIAATTRKTINTRESWEIATLDLANGTDSYTVVVTPITSSGSATVSAAISGDAVTTFEGHYIEAKSSFPRLWSGIMG